MEEFLHDYVTRLADPPVTLLGATDHNGALMIEGLGTFTVNNADDFPDVAESIRHTSLAQLQALGLTPMMPTTPTHANMDALQELPDSDSGTTDVLNTPEMSGASQGMPQVPETPEASEKPVTPKASEPSTKQVA